MKFNSVTAAAITLLWGTTMPCGAMAQTLRGPHPCIIDKFLASASYKDNNGLACYSKAFSTVSGGPTTAQMLVMFTDGQFIQSNSGNVFVVYDGQDSCGFPKLFPSDDFPSYERGLYQVTDLLGSCVKFHLLFKSDSIGQIVPSANKYLAPIEVVGVDKATNKIYGYYPDAGSPDGLWKRKEAIWGDAVDGTLAWEPNGEIGGVSTNGKLFNLWGNFEEGLNYAPKNDVDCSKLPSSAANIGWGSPYWRHRGLYCVDDEGVFTKYTWNGASKGGPTTSKLDGPPATKIARLTPSSNIYGISSSNEVVTLASCDGEVSSESIHAAGFVREVVGIDGESHFFALSRLFDSLRYVYSEDESGCNTSWSTKEIRTGELNPPNYEHVPNVSYFDALGNYNDHAYLIHGITELKIEESKTRWDHIDILFRLDIVDGPEKFKIVEIQKSDVYIEELN